MEEVPRITPENPIRNRKYNSQALRAWGLQMATTSWIGEVRWNFYSILFTTETQTSKKEIWNTIQALMPAWGWQKGGYLLTSEDVIPRENSYQLKTFKNLTLGRNHGP